MNYLPLIFGYGSRSCHVGSTGPTETRDHQSSSCSAVTAFRSLLIDRSRSGIRCGVYRCRVWGIVVFACGTNDGVLVFRAVFIPDREAADDWENVLFTVCARLEKERKVAARTKMAKRMRKERDRKRNQMETERE